MVQASGVYFLDQMSEVIVRGRAFYGTVLVDTSTGHGQDSPLTVVHITYQEVLVKLTQE